MLESSLGCFPGIRARFDLVGHNLILWVLSCKLDLVNVRRTTSINDALRRCCRLIFALKQ